MARPLQLSYPSALYHVMSRGNNRQAIIVVMELLCRHAGMQGTEVARVFGFHESAVSKYRKRARKAMTKDKSIIGLVKDLIK